MARNGRLPINLPAVDTLSASAKYICESRSPALGSEVLECEAVNAEPEGARGFTSLTLPDGCMLDLQLGYFPIPTLGTKTVAKVSALDG